MNENRGAHKRREIHCYELNQNFSSIKEASLLTNIPTGQISACCQGQQKTVRNLTFCYIENKTNLDLTKLKTNQAHRPVYCYELDKEFNHATAAANELSIPAAGIRQCCMNKQNTHYGYRWCYAENKSTTNWSDKKSNHDRSVYCYETDTIYPSILDCATKTNSNLTSVRKACAGEFKTVNGLRFCYAENKEITDWEDKLDNSMTKAHTVLMNLLSDTVELRVNDRLTLNNNKELDLFIPNHRVGIEYNGLYWHQADMVGAKYHINKTNEASAAGVKLIHIFEHQMNENNLQLWKSVILAKCGIYTHKIYARNTKVKKVRSKEASRFLIENHLQGKLNSSVYLGLYFKDELVSLMTFGKPRYSNNTQWELHRFCSKINTIVIGGASKLLTCFEKEYKPESLVSFANLQWSNGDLYNKLGFTQVSISVPSYWWCKSKTTYTRIQCQKHKIVDLLPVFDNTKTEVQNMKDNKFYQVFDCGSIKFEKKYK